LKQGDLIVEAAGRSLATPDDLFDALENVSEDGSLMLRVVRGTDELEVRVAFGAGRVEGSA
jgi:type II secretory pathway component PulC